MSKSPLPADLLRSFDATIMLINEMTAEAVRLQGQFGERSKLYQTKIKQIATIKEFYTRSTEYIEKAVKLNTELGVQCMGMEIMLMQNLHGLSFRAAAIACGYNFSEDFLKIHEVVDDLIDKATKPPTPEDEQ